MPHIPCAADSCFNHTVLWGLIERRDLSIVPAFMNEKQSMNRGGRLLINFPVFHS